MKVAVDFTAGVRQYGGVGRYARGLVRGLAGALAETGEDHRLRLLWAGPPVLDVPRDWPLTEARRLPLPDRWMTVAWQRLRLPLPADLLAGGADVFYCPDFVLPPVARARTVVTVHDLSYVVHPETHFPPLRRYLDTVVPRAVQRADLVFADSEQTREDLSRYLGVSGEKVRVVLSAAEPWFQPAVEERVATVLQRHGIDRPYLFSAGTIQPRKNLVTVFEALRQLVDRGRDLLLVHVGRPGWLYEPIYEALERSGVKNRVRFLAVEDDELVALYSGAVSLVFPSLYEGFGIPCLEAMACGTPVIASHAGSLAEVVQDAGMKVEPLDAGAIVAGVERLLDDVAFRKDLIERGFAQAARFSWHATGRQVRDLMLGLARG